mmetsp:Transcript_15579/g.25803  ORF Transcript_15579/g.25803 Transcript_15579/m.25803 type:complete len:354 (-) Transcript_15579:55-1116(-)|eukprot:CAMPEP_0184647488 /NCGR_PEP_ID=MMETSP0308-20130426/4434_1 /TAXON_ID=38269 /ORGANISM="Gloeochaete witrockiana, Strain SAG 46.84" /LENGTH=353 /DNA_ID=CAMNT_0027078497 /DNA_START=25 /DNA_END=1086 /DNA_ORIENTATION=+
MLNAFRHPTIFATVFAGECLVAANSIGKIAIWLLTNQSPSSDTDSSTGVAPTYSFQAHSSTIYALLFVDKPSRLISGSDQEIRVWDWNDICRHLKDDGLHDSTLCTYLSEFKVPQVSGSRGALGPLAETNCLAYDELTGVLYSASGDNNAHAWDLSSSQHIGVFQGHRQYLHCIACLPNKKQIITGSEDGTVRIWDTRSFECLYVLDPYRGTACESNKYIPPSGNSAVTPWVGCIAVSADENFMICGGGSRTLTLWHLPLLTVTACMPTAGVSYAVMFSDDQILSVGSEPFLYTWRLSGHLVTRVSASSTALFSVSRLIGQDRRLIAVAGISQTIDGLANPTNKVGACTFLMS